MLAFDAALLPALPLMPYLVLALLVLLVIGVMVVAIMARREWKWFHITSAISLMFLCVIFLFPTAASLKARSAWHQLFEGQEKEVAKLKQQVRELQAGNPLDPAVGDGVMTLSQRMAKASLDSGRRWRSLRKTNVANNQVTLDIIRDEGVAGAPQEAPPAGDAPAAPKTPLADKETIVYGFAEFVDPETQMAIPGVYLGEYRVVSSTDSRIVVAPTSPLTVPQEQGVNQSQQWSLYEMLPLDSHEAFLTPNSKPSDDNLLGTVDKEAITRHLGNRVRPETLTAYIEDGRRLLDKDPPLSRWMKVELLLPEPLTFDVDAPGAASAVIDRGFFDGSGRALDARLKRPTSAGASIEFKKGDVLVLSEEAAKPLIQEGKCKLLDRFYLRPLNDYRFILRRVQLEIAELNSRIEELNFENAVLQRTLDINNGIFVNEQDRKDKLEKDEKQFIIERKSIEKHVAMLTEKVNKTKEEMRQLHQNNLDLEEKLAAYHRRVELQVNGVAGQ